MFTTPPTRRRWLQFSLATMLLAVTTVALGCGGCLAILRFVEAKWPSGTPKTATVISQ
jgi:hypothetical protein